MKKKIAIFGASLNPPRSAHRSIIEMLMPDFDKIIIVPCGPRPDKPVTNDIDTVHRAAMADIAFGGLPKVRVELFDLENGTFTRTHKLEEMFGNEGEIWHVVGADLVKGGGQGRSFIQREWEKGEQIWQELNFVVARRQGMAISDQDLPPKNQTSLASFHGSSSEVRNKVFNRESIHGLVDPRVEDYIDRYGLYRRSASTLLRVRIDWPKAQPRLVFDALNPKAVALVKSLKVVESNEPNVILVVGGDGFMLHTIRKHWRERLPFFGINAGTHGFLMNEVTSPAVSALSAGYLNVEADHMPLLYVQIKNADGTEKSTLAFNDVWIERTTGQTAWIEVEIDGVKRIARLMADGILAATPAGSTAYAKAMGALAVPTHAPILTLVGSNVMFPHWKATQIPLESTVTWRTLDLQKRPLKCFVDGLDQGLAAEVTIRKSRIAAVELVTPPDRAEKIIASQFPG